MIEKYRIDSDGKIFLPEEFRKILDITEKTNLTVILENKSRIVIEPYKACCRFCGRSYGLAARDYPICFNCLINLSGEINERPRGSLV